MELKNNLAYALKYHADGFSVIPVRPRGKAPILDGWQRYSTTQSTKEEIEQWWKKTPNANIGIALGPANGTDGRYLFVVDQDVLKDKNKVPILNDDGSFKQKGDISGCPATLSQTTGSGGKQFFYWAPSGYVVGNPTPRLLINIKGKGGQVLVLPSIHPVTGKEYAWDMDELSRDNIAEFPKEMLNALLGEAEKTKLPIAKVLGGLPIGEGLRHLGAAQVAGFYLGKAKTPEEIAMARTALYAWDKEMNKSPEPWEDRKRELDDTFKGILELEMEKLDTEDESSQKMELMKLVTSNPKIELFRDNYGNGHVRAVVDDHKEIMVCRGIHFRQWLTYAYMEQCGNIADPSSLNSAIHAIESTAAFKGEEYKLHNRVAKVGDTIWLDLADKRNRAVRITKAGWEIVDEPPILFRRHTHQKEQVEPQRGGDIKKIFEFLNVTDSAQQLLLLVYLAAVFIPDFPHVLLYAHGEQGSSKSTFFKILRRLGDPSRTEILHMPKDERELKLQLSRNHLVFYDNVDGISDAISAVLCIGVTGGSSSERLYFTNGEDFIFDFRLNIGLNGINISAVKPDLLERSLLFGFKHVDESQRRDEAEVYASFEAERPKILGAILDVVVKALAIRPTVKLAFKPRMADFSLWGVAITEALGHNREEFLNAYHAKISEQSEEALEESAEATTLRRFMDDKSDWQGEPAHLLAELKKIIGDNDAEFAYGEELPKKASQLMRQLNIIKPNLRVAGYELSSKKVNGRRHVFIRKISAKTAQSVHAAPLAQQEGKEVDDAGQGTPQPSSGTGLEPAHKDGTDGVDDIKTEEIPF